MRKTVLIAFLATFAFALAGAKVQAGTSLLKETVIEKLVLQVVSDVQAGDYQVISVEEMKKMIDAKEDLAIIDAHPAWEYDLAYVEGAVNIGFQGGHKGNWEEDVADGHTQEQFLAALGTDKNRKIVIYCGFNL
jgi:thiosulfate/3-mercaptopyruvate sulfurtransferase